MKWHPEKKMGHIFPINFLSQSPHDRLLWILTNSGGKMELSCEMAVKSYGLDAICRGLQGELRSGYPMKAILTGCQERLLAVTKVLEGLE
jgi:hypothetical protein